MPGLSDQETPERSPDRASPANAPGERLMPGGVLASFHGLVLAVIDLAGILIGFAVWQASRSPDQLALQLPVAAVLVLLGFWLWSWAAVRLAGARLRLGGVRPLLWTYFTALAWAALIFVPLHGVTQGYVTSPGNIVALWMFQLPVNLVALVLAGARSLPPHPD